jgi:hypothetical protein
MMMQEGINLLYKNKPQEHSQPQLGGTLPAAL